VTILTECKSVQDVQRVVNEGLMHDGCIVPLQQGYAIQCMTESCLYGVLFKSKYVYTPDGQFVAGSLDFCMRYLVEHGVLEDDDGITAALLLRVLDNSARNGVAWLELQPSQTGHYISRDSGKYHLRSRGVGAASGKTIASGLSVIQMLREAVRLGVLK
jgi:hypothetical protein